MRVTAGIIILLCCGMLGTELYLRQRQCRDILGELKLVCIHIQGCIRYERCEPEEILYSSPKYRLIQICIGYLEAGCSFFEAWDHMTKDRILQQLDSDELSAVREVGTGLGKRDIEGELARLEHLSERINSLYRKRCEVCAQQGKMYISAGFLLGGMVMLMIV